MWSHIFNGALCLFMGTCEQETTSKPTTTTTTTTTVNPNTLQCEQFHQPSVCNISIPKRTEPKHCQYARAKSLKMNRMFYKLTKPGGMQIIKFPYTEKYPFLNQTMETVAFHTALDPVDSKWAAQLSAFNVSLQIMKGLLLENLPNTFKDTKDYLKAYLMHDGFIEKLHVPHKFWNPSMDSSFTDIITTRRFETDADNIFAQQRLAGPCPFLLKLVTQDKNIGFEWEELLKLLNPKVNFDKLIKTALNENDMTLAQAVATKRLYVLYHNETNGLEAAQDYFSNQQKKKLKKLTSPITLFASTNDGKLVVVAIQIDYKPTSKVLTPLSNALEWILAKDMVNMQDINVCNSVWHLSHVHLSGGVFCTIFRSHFSALHPIHQIMLRHCEGTTPHISLTYGILAAPKLVGHQIYGISHTGFMSLTLKGQPQFNYDTLAYDHLMKRHGLDDASKLKYYPFRDDGGVIWKEFQGFAKSFVDLYYEKDSDVKRDMELQSFAKQVSIKGIGLDYGGKAYMRRFPDKFKTKVAVQTFITRFLWQIAMHGAINYPLEPWGSFLPLAPTKMYEVNPLTNKTLITAISDKPTTVGTIAFYSLLGNMRINRVFDYHGEIQDAKLSALVKKHHTRMHVCVQEKLAKRNAERKAKKQMGFQYLEPKWLTNSIHV